MGVDYLTGEIREWMNKNPAPCKRCRARKLGCHAACEPFTGWEAKKEEKKQEIRQKDRTDKYHREAGVRRYAIAKTAQSRRADA